MYLGVLYWGFNPEYFKPEITQKLYNKNLFE